MGSSPVEGTAQNRINPHNNQGIDATSKADGLGKVIDHMKAVSQFDRTVDGEAGNLRNPRTHDQAAARLFTYGEKLGLSDDEINSSLSRYPAAPADQKEEPRIKPNWHLPGSPWDPLATQVPKSQSGGVNLRQLGQPAQRDSDD